MIISFGSIVYLVGTYEMVTVRGVKAKTDQVYIEDSSGNKRWIKSDEIVARPPVLRTKIENGVTLTVAEPSPLLQKKLEAATDSGIAQKESSTDFVIKDAKAFTEL